MTVIDAINFKTIKIEKEIKQFYDKNIEAVKGFALFSAYNISMSKTLLEKWGVIDKSGNTLMLGL